MSNQSKAIVLHSIKYGETSLIVNCFLYDIGVKSFIVKGVLNSKNNVVFSTKNDNDITFPRSAIKIFQALPMIQNGSYKFYNLNYRNSPILYQLILNTCEH